MFWWACGNKRNEEIVKYDTCEVNLCFHHFKLYHCSTTLVKAKEKIIKDIEQYYKDKSEKDKSDKEKRKQRNIKK